MENFWMKPNGQLVKCHFHNDFAREFLLKEMDRRKLQEMKEKTGANSYYELLHKRGWVRVSISDDGFNVRIFGDCQSLVSIQRNTMDPAMNTAQLRAAKRLCNDAGISLQKAVNDQIFWKGKL